MVNIAAFIARCRGMLVHPEATMLEHAQPLPPWQVAAREHALPLVLVSILVWIVPVLMFAPPLVDQMLVLFALEVVVSVLSIPLVAVVVMIFSGMFGGRPSFDAAFVLAALAATPYYLAKALVPLPTVGYLLLFAGMIYSLVLLYQGSRVILQVPQQNRGKHFVLCIVTLVGCMMVTGMILAPMVMPIIGSAEFQ